MCIIIYTRRIRVAHQKREYTDCICTKPLCSLKSFVFKKLLSTHYVLENIPAKLLNCYSYKTWVNTMILSDLIELWMFRLTIVIKTKFF